jgi:Zn-dependent protease
MKCQYCGVDEAFPFDCNYCGKYFCADHRLPENHACDQLWRARKPTEYPVAETPPLRPFGYPRGDARTRGQFSSWLMSKEARHLTAGAVLVLLVGLSLVAPGFRFIGFPVWAVFLSAALFAASFLLHELAHKFTAQKNGLSAEFRMTSFGAVLTIFSIFSPFKIIAPGAVTISGYANESTFGRVAVAGPITNIVIGVLLAVLSIIMPSRIPFLDTFQTALILKAIIGSAAATNGFLAAFNLLPLGILDGRKVFTWNKRVWAIVFFASIALTVLSYYVL